VTYGNVINVNDLPRDQALNGADYKVKSTGGFNNVKSNAGPSTAY